MPNEKNTKSPKIDQKQARTWAMVCHLVPLIGFLPFLGGTLMFPGINIIAPLIVWAWKKNEIPSVDLHGKEVMNFQISLFIYGAVAFFLMLVFIGFLLMPIIVIGGLIFMIIGAVSAYNGEKFTYPFTIRLIK